MKVSERWNTGFLIKGIPDKGACCGGGGGTGLILLRDSSGVVLPLLSSTSSGDSKRLTGNLGDVGKDAKRGILDKDLLSTWEDDTDGGGGVAWDAVGGGGGVGECRATDGSLLLL